MYVCMYVCIYVCTIFSRNALYLHKFVTYLTIYVCMLCLCFVVGNGGLHLPAVRARAQRRGGPIQGGGGPRAGP